MLDFITKRACAKQENYFIKKTNNKLALRRDYTFLMQFYFHKSISRFFRPKHFSV